MTVTLTNGRFFLLALLAGLLAAALFSLGLGGGFVLDDAQTIVTNPLVHIETLDRESLLNAAASFQAGGGSRPLAMVSFALDYWRHGGVDAATFKATNLFIHALTTLFLASFFRQLLLLAKWPPQRAAMCALALALLWAVHPLQVSSVLYVVQRMQTLATMFLVLAMWAYLGLRHAQIDGRTGWPQGILVGVFGLLAIASKEDAVLLPAYLLILELTVLRFQAADATRARGLRNTWVAVACAGIALFLFWAVPHYWSHEAYGGRDFNSIERLLSQARVLMMYLGQIVLPLPATMPFNYDTFEISRSLLDPPATVLALSAIAGLLAWAWLWRRQRPVFACGVMLFFAGHFITSNIIGLEMVFEHRNHFPLIGATLALGDLYAAAWKRWGFLQTWGATVVIPALVLVSLAGAVRAHAWGDPVRFAEYSVEIAPDSPRAWLNLGGTYFDLAGRRNGRDSPYMHQAIAAVEKGARRTGSASAYSNIVIYKSVQGTVTDEDWSNLLQRLREVPMLPRNKNILWTTITNVRADIGLDIGKALEVIEAIASRASFQPEQYLRIGAFIYTSTLEQEQALPYFLRAAASFRSGHRSIVQLQRQLMAEGRADWAQAIEKANRAKAEKGKSTADSASVKNRN